MQLERAVGKTRSWKLLSWKARNEIGKNKVGKFEPKLENFPILIGTFQVKWKLPNLKVSNFEFFPIALSNYMYPDGPICQSNEGFELRFLLVKVFLG